MIAAGISWTNEMMPTAAAPPLPNANTMSAMKLAHSQMLNATSASCARARSGLRNEATSARAETTRSRLISESAEVVSAGGSSIGVPFSF